jgi:hypothetical protein
MQSGVPKEVEEEEERCWRAAEYHSCIRLR